MAAKLWVRRRGLGVYPFDADGFEEFSKVPVEKTMWATFTQPRNVGHHRVFWALCSRIGKGIGKDAEWVEQAFKVATGRYSHFQRGGRDFLVLDSIAFHKMDQIAFHSFFEECVQVMYQEWKIDPATVADLLVREDQR